MTFIINQLLYFSNLVLQIFFEMGLLGIMGVWNEIICLDVRKRGRIMIIVILITI